MIIIITTTINSTSDCTQRCANSYTNITHRAQSLKPKQQSYAILCRPHNDTSITVCTNCYTALTVQRLGTESLLNKNKKFEMLLLLLLLMTFSEKGLSLCIPDCSGVCKMMGLCWNLTLNISAGLQKGASLVATHHSVCIVTFNIKYLRHKLRCCPQTTLTTLIYLPWPSCRSKDPLRITNTQHSESSASVTKHLTHFLPYMTFAYLPLHLPAEITPPSA